MTRKLCWLFIPPNKQTPKWTTPLNRSHRQAVSSPCFTQPGKEAIYPAKQHTDTKKVPEGLVNFVFCHPPPNPCFFLS